MLSMYEAEGNGLDTFYQAFKIPFAGWLDGRVQYAGNSAQLWSASPYDDRHAAALEVLDDDADVCANASAVALPVRCFANSSSPSSSDLSAETEIILTIEE